MQIKKSYGITVTVHKVFRGALSSDMAGVCEDGPMINKLFWVDAGQL